MSDKTFSHAIESLLVQQTMKCSKVIKTELVDAEMIKS